jgi:hypothetical protein
LPGGHSGVLSRSPDFPIEAEVSRLAACPGALREIGRARGNLAEALVTSRVAAAIADRLLQLRNRRVEVLLISL